MFPQFFGKGGVSPDKSGQFQFECGDGWYPLILNLCTDLAEIKPTPLIEVRQVKEKFGELRFTVHTRCVRARGLIDKAMNQSAHICETCGAEGKLYKEEYLTTLCKSCYKNQLASKE